MGAGHRTTGRIAAALFCLVGCGDETDPGGGTGGAGGAPPTTFGGDRPVELLVPESYDPAAPAPLLVTLHGYSAAGILQEIYLQLADPAAARGMLYAYPDGTINVEGLRFWNATDACCDFYDTGVDDSAYLRGLVTEIQQHYSVDPKRIYFVGHSNGGYMSFRMACDYADMVAAIGSLAGGTFLDPNACAPSAPVNILQIHGTDDDSVRYEGGTNPKADYPGAIATAEQWATFNGCSLTPDTSPPPLNLEEDIAGAESTVTRYASGCDPGGSVELWTIPGGSHLPALSDDFAPSVLDHLIAHPKP